MRPPFLSFFLLLSFPHRQNFRSLRLPRLLGGSDGREKRRARERAQYNNTEDAFPSFQRTVNEGKGKEGERAVVENAGPARRRRRRGQLERTRLERRRRNRRSHSLTRSSFPFRWWKAALSSSSSFGAKATVASLSPLAPVGGGCLLACLRTESVYKEGRGERGKKRRWCKKLSSSSSSLSSSSLFQTEFTVGSAAFGKQHQHPKEEVEEEEPLSL